MTKEKTKEQEVTIEREVNGCRLILIFPVKPVEGTMERIQGVLSGAYEERIEEELNGAVHAEMSA